MIIDQNPVLVFLLEELSAKSLLETLIPRILDSSPFEVQYIVFEGKSDLEKKLERRLRGWLRPNSLFVVLRDQDTENCLEIKRRLVSKCQAAGRGNALVRIACCEIESWYLGDLLAVQTALALPNISRKQETRKFRDPDRLSNSAQELERLTAGAYQKVGGSREIGKCISLDVARNKSQSFRAFLNGLNRMLLPYISNSESAQ